MSTPTKRNRSFKLTLFILNIFLHRFPRAFLAPCGPIVQKIIHHPDSYRDNEIYPAFFKFFSVFCMQNKYYIHVYTYVDEETKTFKENSSAPLYLQVKKAASLLDKYVVIHKMETKGMALKHRTTWTSWSSTEANKLGKKGYHPTNSEMNEAICNKIAT